MRWRDYDCNVATPDLFDGDGDGSTCDLDCDDGNAAANSGAAEVCMTYRVVCCESDRERWLLERRQYLGASEIAIVLGLSPWSSPLDLWARKRGLVPDLPPTDAQRWGRRLEDVVLAGYAEDTGRECHEWQELLVSQRWPWMSCTPDAWQAVDGERQILELKTSHAGAAHEWRDGDAPAHYLLQVQQQLAVTGYPRGTLACLIGGRELRYLDIERDDEIIVRIVEAGEAFMAAVRDGSAPPPRGTAADKAALQALYPRSDDSSVTLPIEAESWDAARLQAIADGGAAEARRLEAENNLRAAIGTAAYGVLPSGTRYSLKTTNIAAATIQRKASSHRTLRRSGAKE